MSGPARARTTARSHDEQLRATGHNGAVVVLSVPRGSHTIAITYSDPYFAMGCYIALAFLVSVGTLFAAGKIRGEKRKEGI